MPPKLPLRTAAPGGAGGRAPSGQRQPRRADTGARTPRPLQSCWGLLGDPTAPGTRRTGEAVSLSPRPSTPQSLKPDCAGSPGGHPWVPGAPQQGPPWQKHPWTLLAWCQGTTPTVTAENIPDTLSAPLEENRPGREPVPWGGSRARGRGAGPAPRRGPERGVPGTLPLRRTRAGPRLRPAQQCVSGPDVCRRARCTAASLAGRADSRRQPNADAASGPLLTRRLPLRRPSSLTQINWA